MTDTLTILRHQSNLLAKTWRADGTVAAYDQAKFFAPASVPLADITDLSAQLTKLEGDPHACVIRGVYRGDDHATAAGLAPENGRVRRLLELFDDTPHHWVLVEIDSFEPLTADPVRDATDAIDEYITTCLPECFHGAAYHWQLSNSAGHATKGGVLKAHVWFWLATAYTSAQLKAWAVATAIELDTSVLNPVQVHYTAAPVFEAGVADPVPVRSGFVPALLDDAVALVIDQATLDQAQALKPRQRGDLVVTDDPVADRLFEQGRVLGESREGALIIECPWADEHSNDTTGSDSTVWFPAGTNGYDKGHFKCLHAHCADRLDIEFFDAIGYQEDTLAGFEALPVPECPEEAEPLHYDYYAYLPAHQYIHRPTRQFYPAASVDGNLAYKIDNKKPSAWLDRYRAVQQATWHPDYGELLKDVVVADGGLIPKPGMLVYNRYRPPIITPSDADPSRWLNHLRRIYPEDWEYITKWLAQRIQRPGEKINHALVLGGNQGIGKDTMLHPAKEGVGPWNWADVEPKKMMGQFNPWVESVVLCINETRDLGDLDRFAFYDHTKTYIAAPPDVLMCNDKHAKEYPVFNVMGVIMTTNHKTGGIYLPADDRRHYVAWSEATKEDFDEQYWVDLWAWLESGGAQAVVGYLQRLDLTGFNPKAPPPKTEAFFAIVQANANPDDIALADLTLDENGNKRPVVTLEMLAGAAMMAGDTALHNTLTDPKSRRRIPHMLERAGYVAVRNPYAKDGLWAISKKRMSIYADSSMSFPARIRKAQDFTDITANGLV